MAHIGSLAGIWNANLKPASTKNKIVKLTMIATQVVRTSSSLFMFASFYNQFLGGDSRGSSRIPHVRLDESSLVVPGRCDQGVNGYATAVLTLVLLVLTPAQRVSLFVYFLCNPTLAGLIQVRGMTLGTNYPGGISHSKPSNY